MDSDTGPEIARRREVLGMPVQPADPAGEPLRDWLKYQLRSHGWTSRRVAAETHVDESTVSTVLTNERKNGPKVARVRRLICQLLDIDEVTLFGNIAAETKKKGGTGVSSR